MKRKFIAAVSMAIAAIMLFIGTVPVFAESDWAKTHPRRKQVNNRLNNQNQRINNKVKNGTMTTAQAQKLRANDRNIRQEERDMAKQNGGHITKQEQRTLNQQENENSRQIHRE
jgi:Skp family chaperone for outer membrane proteins